jgi:hypothetical protein
LTVLHGTAAHTALYPLSTRLFDPHIGRHRGYKRHCYEEHSCYQHHPGRLGVLGLGTREPLFAAGTNGPD